MPKFRVILEFDDGVFTKKDYLKIRMMSHLTGLNYSRFDIEEVKE